MARETGRTGKWRLTSLRDFAQMVRWLNRQQSRGQTDRAVTEYFRAALPLLREGITEYRGRAEAVDQLCDHVLSDPTHARRLGFQPSSGNSLLERLHHTGEDLAGYLGHIESLSEADFLAHWRRVLSSQSEYTYLLRRLVDDFGNFERLLPALPGVGELIIDPRTQENLDRMYNINMRNVRIFETIRDLWRSWRQNALAPGWSFFDPRGDLPLEMGRLITEYLLQADPERIRARRQAAQQRGRRYEPYRFWRAAENLRLMADVHYNDTEGRKPEMRRSYVSLQLQSVPPLCVDMRRLNWTFKEILNNSLSASSRMYVSAGGAWEAKPLPRHDVPQPDPAICLCAGQRKTRWWRRPVVRLAFVDEGIGIPPEHLPYVHYWAYSPRREEFRARARRSELSKDQAMQEIQIGGKGIGLSYATAVVHEHGGSLHIESQPGEGTTVTIDLPAPTPLSVGA
ncbi:MAG: ATP-binding protein [Phycisphaerae bacterium]|nr:ATP-binding protein [Phycisphaerae bacterium]